MWRNLICQSTFQLTLLLLLLFLGPQWFNVRPGITCERYKLKSGSGEFLWNTDTLLRDETTGTLGCGAYKTYCASKGIDCIDKLRDIPSSSNNDEYVHIALTDLDGFENICLECNLNGYVHGSIIFNTFIFCQFFNEYTARKIFDEWNCLEGIGTNYVFLMVSIVTAGCQIFLIEVGGEFVKTSPLTWDQWLITVALGAIGIPVGMLMRFIPVAEDPESFFTSVIPEAAEDSPRGNGYQMVPVSNHKEEAPV
jgi:Ca2+-transporting ATPase